MPTVFQLARMRRTDLIALFLEAHPEWSRSESTLRSVPAMTNDQLVAAILAVRKRGVA